MADETGQLLYWLHKQWSCGIAFLVLGPVFTLLRYSTRWARKNVPWGWDDLLILPALLAVITLAIFTLFLAKTSITLTDQSLTDAALESAWKNEQRANYAIALAYPIACALPKLSIACLYLRLFTDTVPSRVITVARAITVGTIIFLVSYAIAFLVPLALMCRPVDGFWKYPPNPQECLNINALASWISLPSLVSDVILLILPLPMVWQLHADRKKKIGITLIFLAGAL